MDKSYWFSIFIDFSFNRFDKEKRLIDLKAENDAYRASLKTNNQITIDEQAKLNKLLKESEVKEGADT